MGYGDAYIYAVVINDYNITEAKKVSNAIFNTIDVLSNLSDDIEDEQIYKVREGTLNEYKSLKNRLIEECCQRNRAVVAVCSDFIPEHYERYSVLTYQPIPVSNFLTDHGTDIWGADTLKEFKNRHLILLPCHLDDEDEFYDRLGRTKGGCE